jgi:FtsP/CotA-like multicopper oxidase with cupredoxin domain
MLAFRHGCLALTALAAAAALAAGFPGQPTAASSEAREDTLPIVVTNDNRRPAGSLADGVLELELRAAAGRWRPEGASGPEIRIEAFGEGASPLTIPAPLIRATEGSEIVAGVRNDLAAPLRVHGLCERGGATCAALEVPAGERREVRFRTGPAGTYHYAATTTGMPVGFRAAGDTQLSGAFIVDPPTGPVAPDRIFVVTEWTSLTIDQLKKIAAADDVTATFFGMQPTFTFLMNGLSWPHTERLTYRLAEPVRWRIVNLSTQVHPMHLHGFFFTVDSIGDGLRDRLFSADEKQRVVTQVLPPGGTMAMTWTPERVGNWLFHCHVMSHVSPERQLARSGDARHGHHGDHAVSAGMAGMVLGVTVTGAETRDAAPASARRMTLVMQSEKQRFGDSPAYGFALGEGTAPQPTDRVAVPGPILVLKRGEPVEISLINRLPEPTAIHWHGMELDSYYDGVHGWSGVGPRVTPLIEPGDSFVVRFTPPRAGTFMYHTHLHDDRQLASGLYGAMLVMEPGETYDPAFDHVFIIGRGGPGMAAPVVLNGERDPRVVWRAGAPHRVRLINITPDDIFMASLQAADGPATWRPVAKDGAPLPPARCTPAPARQRIGVGETYDFEYQAEPGRRTLWLEVRSAGGKWQVQGQVLVK